MRTTKRRTLALTTFFAISTLGVGLASADRGDRRGDRGDRTHRVDRSRQHREAPVRRVERPRRYTRPAHRAHRTPMRTYRAPRHRHHPARVVHHPRRHYRPARVYAQPSFGIAYTNRLAILVNDIMYQADLDGDGLISRWEARRHHRLRGKFGYIDHNLDGVITRHELRIYLR